jgi:hypothetical protein
MAAVLQKAPIARLHGTVGLCVPRPRHRSAHDVDFDRFLFALELFFFAGTFAPFFRASDSPIAIACLRLFTFPPWPDFPRRSVPLLRRRIALFTLLLAPLLYFRPLDFREDVFFAAMGPPSTRG